MTGNPPKYKRFRKGFGHIKSIVNIPDLIGMQRESYQRFLQIGIRPDDRVDTGLQAVFNSVFPIKDFANSASLEFVSYHFGNVKHSVSECINRGMTHEISVRIKVRLVVYDVDKTTGVSNIRDIKEQEIYFGTIPLMTERGTFIINGTERAVVSQLHRSSGVFFDHDKGKTHSSGRIIYTARMIPVRGSWIDMEIDPKDIVNIRIDRRRKFPVTLLFKALGYSGQDILSYFYNKEKVYIQDGAFSREINPEFLKGERPGEDVINPETGEVLVKKGRVFTKRAIRQLLATGVKKIPVTDTDLQERVLASDVYDPETGELAAASNDPIDADLVERLKNTPIDYFEVLVMEGAFASQSVRKTLVLDKVKTKEEALIDIYRRLRPGNPVTAEVAQEFVDHLFFKTAYYDLSGVGRLKINDRLGLDTPLDVRTLRREDILKTTRTLVELRDTQGPVDDIDHLGNRRVRAIGELLENQYRIGLVRMERAIKERMSMQEVDALMPNDLLNPKPVSAVVKEFFGTSQLSQFLDQTNPLSETTHKRRLSALGPGGLTRDRAGFEVRDVHPSHYGRICPIETPEGPNIGLIVSLCSYARVNEFGFIETPYRVVENATVSNEVKLLSAFQEKDHPIAQANAPIDENNHYINPTVTSRVEGEFMMVEREKIELMDVSPNQLVSISASLIPFLENDDANRALMGSNMMRQAVPLLQTDAPLVGTGIENIVARDSGVTIVAKRDGYVVDVNAARIVLQHKPASGHGEKDVTIYNLSKFVRSNQNTCFNHRPIVKKGEWVRAGEIIADGPATDKGELALGKNVTVAFMPWGGYNFEDSILVSERLVKDGVFSSVHIEEFEVLARDTKLGREEITQDIPNVGEEALKDLDESGIIRLGAEIGPGDILVGKVTPKGETQLSPEEKLLRAIFGEKAGEVKDTSLRVPPGVKGVVIDAKVFSRRGVEKDDRAKTIEDYEIAGFQKDRDDEIRIIREMAKKEIVDYLAGKKAEEDLLDGKKALVRGGVVMDRKTLESVPLDKFEKIALVNKKAEIKIAEIFARYREQKDAAKAAFEHHLNAIEKGDDLPPGVIKMIKIYVAMKRTLSVGDKMAGRHGNKGVVSRILPEEDLPYFLDGRTVDMVLNPLGVPSRMNVGQILEIHLGFAAKALGDQINRLLEENRCDALREKFAAIFQSGSEKEEIEKMTEDDLKTLAGYNRDGVYMATPVFDGAREDEIKALLEEAGLSSTGQATLFDGRTGEPFKEKITVGSKYILKLHHLVDDKLHARSIGPYSLVTQQPLGGKAQFGGQRLGEMEVWAIEAYGAAYTLQEFLTVKSDDMAGRTRMYEKIVKGQNVFEPGLPESFRVLTKELQSLGLDVTLVEDED